MAKQTKKKEPATKRVSIPSTVERSDAKAQRTFAETLESAIDSYGGEGERARRAAFSSLKHSYEKVGDHWEPKKEKGPSDAQAARGGADARRRPRASAGGVDANASKTHLMDVAKRLEVKGRSRMSKDELVDAINKANRRKTSKTLGKERSR